MRGMEGDGGESCGEPGERPREREGGVTVLKMKKCFTILEVGRNFRSLLIWSSPHRLPPMRKLRLRKVN